MAHDVVWLRPENSGAGRPPRHTREAVTLAAIRVADRDGLPALTMRGVAAQLGTGGGSLYRHVTSRAELIDVMVDHVAGEYTLTPPSGHWLDDLVAIALQGIEINRRHPWLADVLATPVLGPNALNLIEHVLTVLKDHHADDSQKLVAFAVMNALISSFARTRHGAPDTDRAQRQATYLAHVVALGGHPHLAALAPEEPADPDQLFPDVLRRVLQGLLDPRRPA